MTTNCLLTSHLAALRAGASCSTIHRYRNSGKLTVVKQGPRRILWFDPVEVDRWAVWFREYQKNLSRRKHSTAVSCVNGMLVAGHLPCEEQDEADRSSLFTLAKSPDKKQARVALKQLYIRYNKLRLPLEERRVGIDLGAING